MRQHSVPLFRYADLPQAAKMRALDDAMQDDLNRTALAGRLLTDDGGCYTVAGVYVGRASWLFRKTIDKE